MRPRRDRPALQPLFTWRSAILDSGLPPTARLVALTLSTHMNERGGSCFPYVSTLVAETGLSERTVRTHLQTLEDHGYLKVERAINRASQYTATVPGQGGAAGAPQGAGDAPPGGAGDAPQGAAGAPRGAAVADPSKEEHSKEVIKEDGRVHAEDLHLLADVDGTERRQAPECARDFLRTIAGGRAA